MDHLPRRRYKRFIRNRKGFSAVIGTIFMVLVVLFLYFNVFMFIQKQDARLQDAVSQSAQLDADRNMEQLTIVNGNYTLLGSDRIRITCTIINNSSIPVQIMRLWVQDYNNPPHSGNVSQPVILQPGGRPGPVSFDVNMGTTVTGPLRAWFVTSRGNLAPFMVN
jgi:hypothetical protein